MNFSGHQLSYFLLVTIVYPVIGHIFSCFFLIGWESDIHSLKYNSSVKHTPCIALWLLSVSCYCWPHISTSNLHTTLYFSLLKSEDFYWYSTSNNISSHQFVKKKTAFLKHSSLILSVIICRNKVNPKDIFFIWFKVLMFNVQIILLQNSAPIHSKC